MIIESLSKASHLQDLDQPEKPRTYLAALSPKSLHISFAAAVEFSPPHLEEV